MTVRNRVFSGKGAREESAKALTFSVLSWRDGQTTQPRGALRGFEILSKGKSGGFGLIQEDERLPEVFVRGRTTYSANLNATNPVGTVQSIEHTLRNLDKLGAEQQTRVARIEKELADYQLQADRPFEHEERLKLLLTRQSGLNSLLDLDKGDQQGANSGSDLKDEPDISRAMPARSQGRDEVAKMAEAYMRTSGAAIRECPSPNAHRRRQVRSPARLSLRMTRILQLRRRPTVFSSCHQLLWDATCKSASDYRCGFIKAVHQSTADVAKEDDSSMKDPERDRDKESRQRTRAA